MDFYILAILAQYIQVHDQRITHWPSWPSHALQLNATTLG